MKQTSLRSTTAILVVLSMVQPLPMLAQSGTDGELPVLDGADALNISRISQQNCIAEGIIDAVDCLRFIEDRDAEAAAEALRAEEAEAVAADEAEAEAEASATIAAEEAEAEAAAEAEAEAGAAAGVAAEEADARAREAEETARENEAAARAAIAARDAQDAADRAAQDDAQTTVTEDDDAAATQAAIDARAEAEAEADTAAEVGAQTESSDAPDRSDIEDEATAASQAAADAMAQDSDMATIAGSDMETETPEEVTTEVLTEENRRSSSEEFEELTAEELAREADSAEPAAGRQRGLSDLERAGLIGLGAVAVGAILMNNQRVQQRTGDRVILVDDAGTYTVLKDDDALLRTPGSEVRTERFTDGSTRTVLIRADGTRIITVRDVNGRALRRVRIEPDGREYLLIDDTRDFSPVVLRDLPPPIRDTIDYQAATDRETLRQALLAADRRDIGRSFSLRQVREIVEVRELAPQINLGGVTFETNSAAIQPAQAERLREMGLLLSELIRDDPTELFLVEGHTDAVGDAGSNLLLSDRRAESVALAFSEAFGVGPENLIVQGYGERFLKIPTQSAERENRRVAVRRITALVRQN